METPIHTMSSLFKQLGLDNSTKAISDFINNNKPIPKAKKLHEAAFWTESQAYCLQKMIDEDADWAEIVDQLNLLLR